MNQAAIRKYVRKNFADERVTAPDINRYEAGEMSEAEILVFFRKLIRSGLAWQLQGHYGRMATALIKSGAIDCLDARCDPTPDPQEL